MNLPIYDQPNHPNYGPVRRLHVMLLQLFGDDLALAEKEFADTFGGPWDWWLHRNMTTYSYSERRAQRNCMSKFMTLRAAWETEEE